ncbi:MAG: hypothetical protein HYZ40_19695 [Rhodospirillales bacterium]|nr:hypothetical protein [Rhodospirillales bacterium]
MAVVVWTFLAVLGLLLAWEAAVRLRRWRAGLSRERPATPADGDRYYAPEAELRRELDAAASRSDHAAAVGMRNHAEPRRRF